MAAKRTWRAARVGAAAVVVVVAATACQPFFGDGASLTAEPLGPLVALSWTAAVEQDEGEFVDHYGIEVDGVEVARTGSAATACVLTGLAPAATYSVSVTAYGGNGEWSGAYTGSLASMARVSTDYTTPPAGDAGSAMTCVPVTDSDGDRLPDAVETDTGAFESVAATGTDPGDPDTDDDAIADGDEVLGTTAGLDLPAIGVDALRRDVLLEADWFDDPLDCGAHTHRPTTAQRTRLTNAFASAPVANPDGSTGINVVLDHGQGGALTGGNVIADADGVLSSGVNSNEFRNLKNANMATNRHGYFHYIVMPHRYNGTSNSSGQAELDGDDLIVSLQCAQSTSNVANTIMHELGHNLGLRHGGNVDVNYKPNYNSVMNYRYQFPGVDSGCDVGANGVLDFSRGTRIALVESALNEAHGVCGPGTVALDWNGNGLLDLSPVSVDLNGDSLLSTLNDWNDWATIFFGGVGDADGASPFAEPEVVTEQPVPPGF